MCHGQITVVLVFSFAEYFVISPTILCRKHAFQMPTCFSNRTETSGCQSPCEGFCCRIEEGSQAQVSFGPGTSFRSAKGEGLILDGCCWFEHMILGS